MKFKNLGSVIAKLIAAGMLIIGALVANESRDYQTLLRWVVCGVSGFAAFQASKHKKIGLAWALAIVAIFFNPLKDVQPDGLREDTWAIIDLAAIALLLLSVAIIDRDKHTPPPPTPAGTPTTPVSDSTDDQQAPLQASRPQTVKVAVIFLMITACIGFVGMVAVTAMLNTTPLINFITLVFSLGWALFLVWLGLAIYKGNNLARWLYLALIGLGLLLSLYSIKQWQNFSGFQIGLSCASWFLQFGALCALLSLPSRQWFRGSKKGLDYLDPRFLGKWAGLAAILWLIMGCGIFIGLMAQSSLSQSAQNVLFFITRLGWWGGGLFLSCFGLKHGKLLGRICSLLAICLLTYCFWLFRFQPLSRALPTASANSIASTTPKPVVTHNLLPIERLGKSDTAIPDWAQETPVPNWAQGGEKPAKSDSTPREDVSDRKFYEYCRKAAEQNNAKAQCFLGIFYERGLGGTMDYMEAYKWYLLAGTQGDGDAKAWGTLLANKMTPEQIAEGLRRAREFKPRQ